MTCISHCLDLINGLCLVTSMSHEVRHVHAGMIKVRLKHDFDLIVFIVRHLICEQKETSLISMGKGKEHVAKVGVSTFL